MKEIFEQYGGIIITVVAIMALVTIITFVLSENGVLQDGILSVIEQFTDTAGDAVVSPNIETP